MSDTSLIFIYNAGSGWFNVAADISHKIFSPSTYPCSLCGLTYGVFSIRKEWDEFVKQPPIPFVFWHDDEFKREMPEQVGKIALPAVLKKTEAGVSLFLSKQELDEMRTISELKTAILEKLAS
ncbi:MAG: hypothetical protein WCR52_20070 [Bacteroidota bacterium]